jgi:hypothetical protein
LDAAIASLTKQPNQFQIFVSCAGLKIGARDGGTGIRAQVENKGANFGSITGVHIGTSTADCEVVQTEAKGQFQKEGEKVVSLLNEIKALLQAPKVDEVAVKGKLAQFGETYVAPVLKEIIPAMIKKKLGL